MHKNAPPCNQCSRPRSSPSPRPRPRSCLVVQTHVGVKYGARRFPRFGTFSKFLMMGCPPPGPGPSPSLSLFFARGPRARAYERIFNAADQVRPSRERERAHYRDGRSYAESTRPPHRFSSCFRRSIPPSLRHPCLPACLPAGRGCHGVHERPCLRRRRRKCTLRRRGVGGGDESGDGSGATCLPSFLPSLRPACLPAIAYLPI